MPGSLTLESRLIVTAITKWFVGRSSATTEGGVTIPFLGAPIFMLDCTGAADNCWAIFCNSDFHDFLCFFSFNSITQSTRRTFIYLCFYFFRTSTFKIYPRFLIPSEYSSKLPPAILRMYALRHIPNYGQILLLVFSFLESHA